MQTKTMTLGYLAAMTREHFDKLRTASIVGEINAKQFINNAVHLTKNNPLHGKADLFDIVQDEQKQKVT